MSLEADIAYLHLIDGVRQGEVPPGFSVHSAPRKAARGRDRDVLLVGLYLGPGGPRDVVDRAVSAYFGTPGSVTAAARATLQAANAQLYDYNRYPPASGPVTGGLCLAVLRGADLYVALLGSGQVVVVHPAAVERFPDRSAEPPAPFGLETLADVQYFHTLLAAADYALFTADMPPGWETNALTNLPATGLESAVARLTRLAGPNASAMVARFTPADADAALVKGRPSITAATLQGAAPLREPAPAEAHSAEAVPPASHAPDGVEAPAPVDSSLAGILARVRASPALGDPGEVAAPPAVTPQSPQLPAAAAPELAGPRLPVSQRLRSWIRGLIANLPLHRAGQAVKQSSDTLGTSLSGSSNAMLRRVLPEGTLRPDTPLRVPDRVLMAIAVLLPVVIAIAVGVIYIQRGRNQQYRDYLDRARLEAGLARTAPDLLAAKPHWLTTLQWLDQADRVYPGQSDSAALRREAQAAVDQVDDVTRLNVQALIPTGFSSGAVITQIVVQGTEVYALDSERQSVYRALLTDGDKYVIDRNFQCQLGVVGSVVIKRIVDIAWLETPNIVSQPALMALDVDGDVMYCKTDGTAPQASTLIPPDSGWKNPKALEIYAGRLYIFDPGANDIWAYDRVGGVFSERPRSYFTGQILDLSSAVNFTIAQGEVYILRGDGRLTYCVRDQATQQTHCVENSLYTDSRPGHASGDRLDDASRLLAVFYDPPPEPSLYLLDADSSGVYQLSLKLVLQKVYKSAAGLPGPVAAVAIGPNKEVFVAAGNNVYWARR